MPILRRCYTYTTDEQLTKDTVDGLITAKDAQVLRDFREFLAVPQAPRPAPEGLQT